jgi:photosystem II stability/assembly factor-like uncharacterized protein
MLTEQEVVDELTNFYRTMDDAVDERTPAWRPGLSRLRSPSWRVQLMATAALLVLAIGVGLLVREARLIKPTSPVTSPGPRGDSALVVDAENQFMPVGLLSDRDGWQLSAGHLSVSRNGGVTWQEITPAGSQSGGCCMVFFLDARHGWAGGAWSPSSPTVKIFETLDGGTSWTKVGDAGPTSSGPCCPTMDFIDMNHGWIIYNDGTSAGGIQALAVGAGYTGKLLQTTDGGAHWSALPNLPAVAAQRPFFETTSLHFVDSQRGWYVGSNDQISQHLFMTQDGGQSWSEQRVPVPSAESAQSKSMAVPSFLGTNRGVLPITTADGHVFVDVSNDGGRTWKLDRAMSAVFPKNGRPLAGVGMAAPSYVGNGVVALVVGPDLEINTGGGWKTITPAGANGGIYDIQFANSRVGWALMQHPCALCAYTQYDLKKTSDGGRTWTDVRS